MAGGLTIADISGEGFTPAELNAASYLYKQGGNYVVLRTAVGTRAGGGTSDLLVNGTRWDVYTPEADTSVRNIMSTAAGKWTQVHGGGVFIDLSNTGLSAVDMGNALARINGFINSWGGTPVSGVRFYGG